MPSGRASMALIPVGGICCVSRVSRVALCVFASSENANQATGTRIASSARHRFSVPRLVRPDVSAGSNRSENFFVTLEEV
jgi:hypothetical protein